MPKPSATIPEPKSIFARQERLPPTDQRNSWTQRAILRRCWKEPAAALMPGIVQAVVKQAIGRTSAACLPPQDTTELIEQCAARGVDHLLSEPPPQPFRLAPPLTVTVEFVKTEMADSAALMPGAHRDDGRRVSYVARNMPEAYRAFRTLVELG